MNVMGKDIAHKRDNVKKVFVLVMKEFEHILFKRAFKTQTLHHRHTNATKSIKLNKVFKTPEEFLSYFNGYLYKFICMPTNKFRELIVESYKNGTRYNHDFIKMNNGKSEIL